MTARLVVVEDSPGEVELLRVILRPYADRLTLSEHGTAESLIEELEDRSILPPALLLLDINLPGASGFVVLERVRGNPRWRRTPVVVLTSSADPRDGARAYDLGASGVVRKPLGVKQFKKTLDGILTYWLEVVVPPPSSEMSG